MIAAPRRAAGPALALGASLVLLAGCKSAPAFLGAAAGLATGAGTANPAIAAVVGIGVRAGADYVMRAYTRGRAHTEQVDIATAAGQLAPGQTTTWAVHHFIPIGNEHGDMTVTRVFATKLTTCKEVVFSVIDGKGPRQRHLFTTMVCQDTHGWHWAAADPAVARWGYLQ